MTEIIRPRRGVAIMLERKLVGDADERLFDPSSWARVEVVPAAGGGRGQTLFVADERGEFVLRHYYRGGMPRHIVRDRYLWCGEQAARSFAEMRLLATMRGWGLPVPEPAAAGYRRFALAYAADLLTVRLPGVRSLAQCARGGELDGAVWRRVGATIRRFHDRGVWHADLNAHNVLLGREGAVWLLDFDRGRIRRPGRWQAANLARLERSMSKVAGSSAGAAFSQSDWRVLLDAYRAGRC